MKRGLILWLLSALLLSAFWILAGPGDTFPTSLHATRNGKAYWYAEEQGGFYSLTGVPIEQLGCARCHAANYPDGAPVDHATYEPSCRDCHNFAQGTAVASATCRGCHSRQNVEFSLAGNPNPEVAELFKDVHKEAGFECMDCHTLNEMHGTGTEYNSMFDEGAMETSCDMEGCHASSNGKSAQEPLAHQIHADNIHCTSCHARTVVACYNCHFETEIEIDKKRFYGPPPLNGFVMLVNDARKGKINTASFQSVTYGDTTFYAVGPFGPHTISREARPCESCHNNAAVQAYNTTGKIPFMTWDEEMNKLISHKGVFPLPEDYATALELHFVRFTGNASDPIDPAVDPTKWEFMKATADKTQMLFATPLTPEQWSKISIPVTATDPNTLPEGFVLRQNYPNPFNPTTTIEFLLDQARVVFLSVYDVHGRKVATLLDGSMLPSGMHRARLDATTLSSGTYIYRLEADGRALTRAMTLLR